MRCRAEERYPNQRKRSACAGLLTGFVLIVVSFTPTPAWAQDIIPPKVYTTTPGGVNLSDGSFVYSVTDLSIGPLTLQRFHITGTIKPDDPFIGKNMGDNFDIYVAPNRKSVSDPYRPIVHIGNSASGVYAQSGTSVVPWNQDAQRSGSLALSSGNYIYTDRTGTIYTFSSAISAGVIWGGQRATKITFPDGRVQTLSYNTNNQPKLITDSSGYAIVFDYNTSGDVSAACGFDLAQNYVTASSTCTGATLKVTYSYTSGVLTSVTDVMSQTTTYPGNVLRGVTCVKPPGYASCQLSMSYSGDRVITQTMADGTHWVTSPGFPAVNDPDSPAAYDGDGEGTITDPDGKVTDFTFTKTSPYTKTDANGKTTQYRFTGALLFDYTGAPYHDGTMLIQATLPEGNTYLAEYNGPFKSITKETMQAKPGSGLADLVKTYGYVASCTTSPGTYQNCAKPIWIKDPNGNQTDYAYYSFGGTQWEMQPPPAAGGARPLKLYSYTQKYAYVKNSAGTLVPAATPIWMLTSETACQTVAGSNTPTCDPAAQIIVTNYEYGANGTADNLLLRGKIVDAGTGKLNLRTCYSYDNYGNKISETEPRASLGSCP